MAEGLEAPLRGDRRSRFEARRVTVSNGREPHAIHKAREAVDFAYNAAGATAIFENHPLERRFRDIHTVDAATPGPSSGISETVGALDDGRPRADLTFV